MDVVLAPSTYLKDEAGRLIGEPGQTVSVTLEEADALLRTGSAYPADPPATTQEG